MYKYILIKTGLFIKACIYIGNWLHAYIDSYTYMYIHIYIYMYAYKYMYDIHYLKVRFIIKRSLS